MITPEIITTEGALWRRCDQLQREPLLAFDLEADSLHHYTEKVCLIQISTAVETFLVDPLALDDLSPLGPILADAGILKLFHGADYDIRSLHRDFGFEVANLFDTMVAAQFLGEPEIGLAAQLKKRFGVELDKRYQRADWSRRPLEPGMISYAAQDTGFLIPLYRQMSAELRMRGRLSWVEEECRILARVRMTDRSPREPLFLRFKGASRMHPRTLAVLEEVLRFRDECARRRDVPPFKVLGNEAARTLAERKPRAAAELKEVTGLTPRVIERYGRELIEAVARGMALDQDRLPSFPRTPRPARDAEKERRLKRLKEWREAKAIKLGIDAGIVANNSLLELFAETRPDRVEGLAAMPGMKRWQNEEFGEELAELVKRG